MKKSYYILILALISIILLLTGCKETEITEHKQIVTPIYSLDTKMTQHGTFIYGTGYIDGALNYYVYAPDGDGYIIKHYDASSTIVVDKYEEPNPRVIEDVEVTRIKKNISSIFNPISMILPEKNGYYVSSRIIKTTMYLPKGTIRQQYNTEIK